MKRRWPMASDRLCIRKSDGSIWEPITPPGYTHGQMVADCMLGKLQWCFWRLIRERVGWWIFKRLKWVSTGQIWQPTSGEFNVLTEKEARRQYKKVKNDGD